MKLTPIKTLTKSFPHCGEDDIPNIGECCDSAVAVLNPDQLAAWEIRFEELVNAPDAGDFCEGWAVTNVFDIDGKLLTVVSDSGGEVVNGEFMIFCEDQGIDCQFIVDSMDCTDVPVEDINTGSMDDYPILLEMIHKIFN